MQKNRQSQMKNHLKKRQISKPLRKQCRLDEIRQLMELIPGLNNRPNTTEVTVIEETIKFITRLEDEVIQRHYGHSGGVNFDRSRPQMHPLLRALLPRRSESEILISPMQSAENSPCRTSDEEHW
ncbi:hypothetical protein ECG_00244 [Echinococcus granulosus]|uniref:BHLH domain-containing protein n=1 Tax=Echinococcus granulosus TaxID=6210 RepID=U6JGY4_ECHGR|nr:hypothetical protein EGR_03425 [Echinococcus granulosus]EUB61611.1 hypothetical protein EGR_03425 [Echinococcus granulosus]KAH9286939.1 hypothetical protein ECG_00244 [Echinococcus granulosus]CDS22601.1 hypothetical protein EgrG_001176300 [Echinococcus granulosus]